jgi:hypothetical protein
MHKLIDRVLKVAAGVVLFVSMSGTAWAGPPLICHPFDAGTAALLPWTSAPGWKAPDPSYDVQKLVADTLRLLTPTTPVIARMEIMRRATIYAGQDRKVAAALLKAVIDRAKSVPAGSNDPMPQFDAGYLIESYRQGEGSAGHNMLEGVPAGTEGYGLVVKAIRLAGENAEMEFAASLMQRGTVAAEHRNRARAGAARGSLLERNLANFGQ